MWLAYRDTTPSTELAERFRSEAGVLVVPGDQYGMDGWLPGRHGQPRRLWQTVAELRQAVEARGQREERRWARRRAQPQRPGRATPAVQLVTAAANRAAGELARTTSPPVATVSEGERTFRPPPGLTASGSDPALRADVREQMGELTAERWPAGGTTEVGTLEALAAVATATAGGPPRTRTRPAAAAAAAGAAAAAVRAAAPTSATARPKPARTAVSRLCRPSHSNVGKARPGVAPREHSCSSYALHRAPTT